ncbi:hypothetical protein KNT64_gp184 [Pseudomonas phage PspYZU05]|uniref:SprT-like domain-containing protein n=1 Tax=Pseudomonas phage PspYZU05 TaxID=1983556 RepID=A0A2U7N568_9CAUD|nr:hypothetical protein KNT64_gp184 [Pseudomonas phage PspYZU05]ASD52136.1 hypothetical protein PspYZU05_184 [Pseudomonas phage PspYZU05]
MNIKLAKEIVRTKLDLVVAHANLVYDLDLDPALKENRGKCAGKASANAYTKKSTVCINYNMMLVNKDNWDSILEDTIAHEVAHIVEYMLVGKMSHSSFWSEICITLGGTGKRYHNLKLATVQYIYEVNGHKLYLTAIKHNRIQSGVSYRCKTGNIYPSHFVGVYDPLA